MTDVIAQLTAALADRYQIERELGAGGMATVYLAHDLKHNRKVALKVLRPELAAIIGAERFLKEIEVTANLQHPNILPLYDSGRAAEFLFYVMPFIQGETLRDKLDREKQLRVDDALEITKSVAAALDYAHRQNVVHRDIKPENILLHEGQALVADFGIALAVSQAGGPRLTETGLSLGTPHYMSPEQATGERSLDARSDVYSLGCVVYEMLVGEPPHLGNSVQAVIAKILTDEPQPVAVRRNTIPLNVDAAVGMALAKLPADRFASTAEFVEALQNPAFTTTRTTTSPGMAPVRAGPWKSLALALAAATAMLAAVLAWSALRTGPTPPVSRQRVLLAKLPSPSIVGLGTAIAPDGSAIVFQDSIGRGTRLWIKERDQIQPTALATPDADSPVGPFFSPDGTWIAFCDGKLRKVPRTGGAPITVSDSVTSVYGGAWLDDGTIVFPGANGQALYRVNADGGQTERIAIVDSLGILVVAVTPLPKARGVLLGAIGPANAQSVWALDLHNGTAHEIVPGAAVAWYLPSGMLVFARPDGSVFVAPVDLGSLSLSGPAVPAFAGVRTVRGLPDLQASANGTLLYALGSSSMGQGRGTPTWVTRTGQATPVDSTWHVGIVLNGGVSLSPDGRRIALSSLDSSGRADMFVRRVSSGVPSRLTFEGMTNIRPAWSPDGERLLYVSDRDGTPNLWLKPADGSEQARPVGRTDRPIWEGGWSPDGTWLLLRTDDVAVGHGDILGVRLGADSAAVPLVATDAEETSPAFSPDGRWLAYASGVSGRKEVYVRPFPNVADGPWQVSTAGGTEPRWAHNGRELFYRNGRGYLEVASIHTTPSFEVGDRHELFDANAYAANDDDWYYAVAPDDQRFLMILRSTEVDAGSQGWILVENMLPELETMVGR